MNVPDSRNREVDFMKSKSERNSNSNTNWCRWSMLFVSSAFRLRSGSNSWSKFAVAHLFLQQSCNSSLNDFRRRTYGTFHVNFEWPYMWSELCACVQYARAGRTRHYTATVCSRTTLSTVTGRGWWRRASVELTVEDLSASVALMRLLLSTTCCELVITLYTIPSATH